MQKVREKMLKAYKFRLYPTKEQIVKLNMHFGHTHFVYNYFLEYSKTQYKDGNKTNYNDWSKVLTQLKRTEDYSWLKDVNSQTLQQSLMDLQSAFKHFFSHRGRYPINSLFLFL
jgi:putative transposase